MVSGEIADFGGKISVTKEGMAYAIETNNGNIKSASLAPAVPLIDAPDSIFANIDRKTAEDMVINYRILGNLLDVTNAVIEIRDDAGDIVFSEQVPVQAEGQVIWPAGQPMNPTPNDIRFQVENPDGTQSNFVSSWPEIQFGSTPTPILTLVNPWHVVRGATGNGAIVTLTGRNFRATSTVVFESDNGNTVIQLPASFTDNTKLTVLLPTTLTSNVISGTVRVLNGGIESDTHILKIVEYALPDAPVLSSITPSQLNSSWNPADTWITIHGSNFIDNDTVVKSDHIPSELETEFVSVNELRALVPAVWMSGPARIHLYAESLTNTDLVSQVATLEILNTIGLNLPPIAPILYGVNNSSGISYVPLAQNPNSPATKVKITGEGFLPNAIVQAIVNGEEHELETEFVNSREIEATVPAWLFSRRDFTTTITLSTAAGSGQTQNLETSVRTQESQITFHEVSSKGANTGKNTLGGGVPSGSSLFQRMGEYGFHYKRITNDGKQTEYVHVVVPEENGACRQIVAAGIIDRNATDYYSSKEPYVTVTKRSNGRFTMLDLCGTGMHYNTGIPYNTEEIYLEARTVLGQILAEARLWLMPLREYNVKIFFVADINNPTETTPNSMPGASQEDREKYRKSIETDLNLIWKQANVKFNITIDNGLNYVSYDHDNNKHLAYPDPNNELSYKERILEYQAIVNGINFVDSANVRVFFVRLIDGGPTGFSNAIGGDSIFISDLGNTITTFAHELGHVLGLPHNRYHFNIENPFSFDILDSDYNDKTSVMWNEDYETNKHIGSPFWKRLNEVRCYRGNWATLSIECTNIDVFNPPY